MPNSPIGNLNFLDTTLPTKFCESFIKSALRDSPSETHLVRYILPPKWYLLIKLSIILLSVIRMRKNYLHVC